MSTVYYTVLFFYYFRSLLASPIRVTRVGFSSPYRLVNTPTHIL